MNTKYERIARNAARLCGLAAIAALSLLASCVGSASSARHAGSASGGEAPGTAADVRQADDSSEQTDRYRLAQDHFIIARDYERRGMHDMAEQLYEIAYDFWPDKYLRKNLLDRYLRAEEYEKALALYREYEGFDSLTGDEKRTISVIYLRTGNTLKAAEAIEALGAERSEEETYSLALLYGSLGDRKNAYNNYRRFFSGNPNSAPMGIRLVRFNVGDRKMEDADSLAAILHEAYPQNADVIALMGTVKHLQRDTAAAFNHFKEALALDSLNEEALRTLAHIHITKDQYSLAAPYYRRLTAQEGIGTTYRRGLALLLFYMKEYDEAEALFSAMIDGIKGGKDSKDISNPQELYMYRGLVYSMSGKLNKALADMHTAVAADSSDPASWMELGNVLEKLKRRDEAAKAYKQVLRLRPGDAVASNNLGYMWAEIGVNLDSARTLIEAALKKDPANGAYLDSYAWVFYRLGDYEKALHYMNESLKQREMTEEAVSYEHLGDIQFMLKDYTAAEKAYNRAIELKTEDAARIKKRLAEIRELLRKKKGP